MKTEKVKAPNEPMYLDLYSPYGAGDELTYNEAYDRAAEVVSILDMWEQLEYILYISKEWSPKNLLNYLPAEMRQELFDRAVKNKFDAFYTEIRKDEE